MLTSVSRAAIAAALLSAPTLAMAQSNGALEGVVVTGAAAAPMGLTTQATTSSRLGLTPLETPASIQVISGELVRQRGDLFVTDAVTRAAGVTNAANSGNGGTGLSARGFTGVDSVKRIYDGIEMFAANGTVTFPFDSWMVDRIEVLSGPSSVMYGTGAIGGVVNVVPRKPNPNMFENSARLTYGSLDTWRGAVDSTGPIAKRLSYRVDVSGATSDGYVDRGHNSGLAVTAALRFEAASNLNFTLSDDYGLQQPMRYGGVPLINGAVSPATIGKNYNVGNGDLVYRDNMIQLKGEWAPTDKITVRSDLYTLASYRKYFAVNTFAYQPATGLVLRSSYSDLEHRVQQYGFNTVATMKDELFGLKNDLSVGFDVNRVKFRFLNPRPSATTLVDLNNSNPGLYLGGGPGTNARFTSYLKQHSVFGEDRLALTAKLSLVGGLRVDSYDVTRNDFVALLLSNGSFSPGSWRVGAVYDIQPNLAVYAQYSTATDALSSVASLSAVQQALQPTHGRQFEVGAKQSLLNGLAEWTVSAYNIVKKNLLIPDEQNPGLSVQVGQQTSQGLEASLALNLAKGLRLEANGTVLKATFDDFREVVSGVAVSRAGNTPTNVPRKAANLWLTWDPSRAWQARIGLRYVGDRFTDNANTVTAKLPAYTLIDAGVRWNVNDKHPLDLRVFNATDAVYATTASSATQWRLAAPRTVEISWTGRF